MTGASLPLEDIIASHAVYSQVECSLKCLRKTACVGYNFKPHAKNTENCQISKHKALKRGSEHLGEWTFYQDLEKAVSKNIT